MLKKLFKSYGLIALTVLVVLTAAILRYSGKDSFSPDAIKHAIPSVAGRNIIKPADITGFSGDKLLVSLDGTTENIAGSKVIRTSPGEIFSAADFSAIKNNRGPVFLLSEDPSVAARAWMLLSQKGLDNIFIVSEENDEESKNEFRPDTLVKPELMEF